MSVEHQITQAYDLLHKSNQQMTEIWLHHVLFTWQWWLGTFLTIAPWIFWWLVKPKDSSGRLLYVIFFVIIITSWLDFLGSGALGLWHYYYEVLPFIPSFIPWDFTIIPILVALTIQYKPKANPIIKAIICSGIFSFIGEPVFEALKMYAPNGWRNYYSFIVMCVIYLVAHYLSKAKNFQEI